MEIYDTEESDWPFRETAFVVKETTLQPKGTEL
jgi:hypothetical protein